MSTRTLIGSDNFNRADGAIEVGQANWTQTDTNWGSVSIVTNAVAGGNNAPAAANFSSAKWTAGSWVADQYAKVTISGLAFNGNNCYVAVIVRHDTGSNPSGTDTRNFYYACVLDDNSGSPANRTTEINKCINGTRTNLSSVSDSWANGDTVSIEAEGTTISVFKNDVFLRSVTDASITGSSTSRAGIGTSTAYPGDNWEGGTLGTGAVDKGTILRQTFTSHRPRPFGPGIAR